MGLAEDLKVLQELRDKGELSESAYASARDAAIGKQAPVPAAKPTPQTSGPVKAVIVIAALFVIISILSRMNRTPNQGVDAPHLPTTVTDEIENVPANSWKALNYIFPSGGKLEITVNVVNGNPIDIFLTTADQLDTMKKGDWQNVKVYSDFSATQTRTYRRTQHIGPGNYYFVVRDPSLGVLSAHASDVSVKTILTP
jgi:hypothetical protein